MQYSSHAPSIPTRPFGRTGIPVSILALGGWHLGLPKTDAAATRLAHAAIDAGITFLDNAWDYNDGLSETRMGKAIHDRRDQVFLMTKVCTHGRDGKVAMRQLEQSLKRLKTDYLDLWQIHEVVFDDEPARHFARGGVVEALDRAREQGKVRFVGFTGHKDPRLHLEMLAHDYPWDACQLPLNCFDATFRSFEQLVLPELTRRGIAVVGMKSFWRRRPRAEEEGRDRERGAVLRHEPAHRDAGERHGHARGAAAERGDRARLPADDGETARGVAPARGRCRPPMGASSSTRSARCLKATSRAACTGCRRMRRS